MYRTFQAGIVNDQATPWDLGWQLLVEHTGSKRARSLYGEFHHFFRTLSLGAARTLAWRPLPCRGLCEDEEQVLRVLHAGQSGNPDCMTNIIEKMVHLHRMDDVVDAANLLASALYASQLSISSERLPALGSAGACQAKSLH